MIRTITLTLFLSAAGHAQLTEIAIPSRAGAGEPFLYATKSSLIVSWTEPNALRFARFDGVKWSDARTIVDGSDVAANWANSPSVIEDANGVMFAHWLQKSGAGYSSDVRVTTSHDGGRTWSKSFLLNRDGKKTEHGFVSLAPLTGGGVAALWLDGRKMREGTEDGEMTLRYATIDANGFVRGESEIDARVCECCGTAMTIAKSGPFVAYRDRSANEVRDVVSMRKLSNGWTRPRAVHDDGWKMAGCPVNGPQADSIGDRVAVAWFTGAHDKPRAYVAFSNDGGATFAKPVTIDEGQPAGRVDVVMIDDDSALVTWVEQTQAGGEIRARRVHRNGTIEAWSKIASIGATRGFPRVARLTGNSYFAWTEQNGKTKRIHMAVLSSSR
jgi:hypothetical protein